MNYTIRNKGTAMDEPNEELKRKWDDQVQEMKKLQTLEDDVKEVHFIAGVDISFVKDDPYVACSGLVLMTFPEMKVVFEDFRAVRLNVPYVPGYLAFREVEHIQVLLQDLREKQPHLFPQLLFVDGNGTHHPQRFGLACHLGVMFDVPTIGIGKSFLVVDGLQSSAVKDKFIRECSKQGSWLLLLGNGKNNTPFGAAVATVDNLKNAIFVSPGHKISIETAVEWTLKCSRYRQPEPIRYADQRSRAFLREKFPDNQKIKN